MNASNEESSVQARQPASLSRWLLFGGAVGLLFGLAYGGLLAYWVADDDMEVRLIIGGAVFGLMFGAGFANLRWAKKPCECSLCTWIAFLLGMIPALILFLGIGGAAAGPRISTGVILAPPMAGLLLGGLLDRFVEPLLFREVADDPVGEA